MLFIRLVSKDNWSNESCVQFFKCNLSVDLMLQNRYPIKEKCLNIRKILVHKLSVSLYCLDCLQILFNSGSSITDDI